MISLVLGLGNLGQRYAGTRHNLGFDLVDRLCGLTKARPTRANRLFEEYRCRVADREIILAKPMTFMNLSGVAARALLQDHSFEPANMLVVVDDFSLPLGSLRMRSSGSDGGHNGLASIIDYLESDQFPRLRLGIGPVADNKEIVAFVLEPFEAREQEAVARLLETGSEAVLLAITHRLELAMSKYNRPPALPEQE